VRNITDPHNVPIWSEDGEIRRWRDIENDLLRLAIVHYRGNCSEAAEKLGMSRTNIYRRIRDLGIGPPALAARANSEQ
jgi:transcriptional regulator of acetoin/glycerol metabolism